MLGEKMLTTEYKKKKKLSSDFTFLNDDFFGLSLINTGDQL